MANVKISELPVATSVTGPDSFPVVQGGVTKQATRSVLFASPTFTGTTTANILTATGNVTFDGGAFVFNESGVDKDARFEGDTDANLLFLDASTDRVGIGTATPTEKLSIGQGNIYALRTGGAKLRLADQNDEVSVESLPVGLASAMTFSTSGVEHMRLDASGNLGIGTTSPGYKLEVVGPSNSYAANFRTNIGTSANDAGVLFINVASATAASRSSQVVLDPNGANGIGGDYAYLLMTGDGTLTLGNQFNGALVFSGSTERMRLDASGNLGIGTTSPGANLQLGASTSGSQVLAFAYSATSAGSIDFQANGSAFGAGWIQHDAASGALRFATAGVERARITIAGDFIHQVNNAAPTLTANSTMSFELTSNTSLKIVVRGTDGTTRSVSLTLS